MPSILTALTAPSLASPWKSAVFTKPIAPGEPATVLFTLWAPPTSFGGVADLPVKAACMKYLPKSASFMPQTIFRNAVRSGAPAVTITGATAFPVSHRLRSERKSFFKSPTVKLSTGLEAFTITTMEFSPALTGGGAIMSVARANPRTAIPNSRGIHILDFFMTVSPLESECELAVQFIAAAFATNRHAVILQLEGCVLIEVIPDTHTRSLAAPHDWTVRWIAINVLAVSGIDVLIPEVRTVLPEGA